MALIDRLKQMLYSEDQKIEGSASAGPPQGSSNSEASVYGKQLTNTESDRISLVITLTPREYDVYRLLVEGYTLKECAKELSVKYSTVNTHMTSLYKKLGVSTRAELIINYRGINDQGHRMNRNNGNT
jgi:DNA-binding CsgD family transcriptional regulator